MKTHTDLQYYLVPTEPCQSFFSINFEKFSIDRILEASIKQTHTTFEHQCHSDDE